MLDRLRLFGLRINEARGNGQQLVAQFQQGSLSNEDMADFVRSVRPLIAYERELLTYAQRHSVAIEAMQAPVGDPSSLATKLELLVFHLAKCAMLLDSVVAAFEAERPADSALLESITALVHTGESLIEI